MIFETLHNFLKLTDAQTSSGSGRVKITTTKGGYKSELLCWKEVWLL